MSLDDLFAPLPPAFGGGTALGFAPLAPAFEAPPAPEGKAGALSHHAERLEALQTAMGKRGAEEAKRFRDATDAGYYFCVAFALGEHRDAFLAAMGGSDEARFFDGHHFAAWVAELVTAPEGERMEAAAKLREIAASRKEWSEPRGPSARLLAMTG